MIISVYYLSACRAALSHREVQKHGITTGCHMLGDIGRQNRADKSSAEQKMLKEGASNSIESRLIGTEATWTMRNAILSGIRDRVPSLVIEPMLQFFAVLYEAEVGSS
ncbi:hypothetical protein ACQZ4X_04760 [Agrobacterium vitis]